MKFVCNTRELSDALSTVGKAISNKANIPILEGIKIRAEGDEVTLAATDLELYIISRIKADVRLEGETVVTGRVFQEFMKKVADENVEIEKYTSTLAVNYGVNVSEFQCMEDETYPEFKDMPADNGFVAKDKDLRDAIEGVIFCAAQDDSRPILRGCKLEVEDDELVAAALDGYRLGVTKCRVFGQKGDFSAVIPAKNLQEIVKIIGEEGSNVTVNAEKSRVLFDLGSTKIVTRVLEGEFIQYKKIIPEAVSSSVTVNKSALENGLDRATLVAKNKKNYVKLSLSSGKIDIDSSSELGKIHESVPCELSGKDIEIAFNTRYLFDAFARIKEDNVKINLSTSNAPAVIVPGDGDRYLYLVLPVRLIG